MEGNTGTLLGLGHCLCLERRAGGAGVKVDDMTFSM